MFPVGVVCFLVGVVVGIFVALISLPDAKRHKLLVLKYTPGTTQEEVVRVEAALRWKPEVAVLPPGFTLEAYDL
jgi:hypothetical protein